MATDPVCGMFVDPAGCELKLVRGGRTFYFCCERCLSEFAEPARELASLRRRTAVAAPLAAAIVVLVYAHPLAGSAWIAFAFAAVVQGYAGLPFYRGLADAARSRSWNMDVLIATGTSVAFGYSAVTLVVSSGAPPATYFDASSIIITLLLLGNVLEMRTRERARGTLLALDALRPSHATLVEEARDRALPISEVRPGDRLRVLPGERFPSDGVVVDGRSEATEAMLTGEPMPVPKAPNDPVLGGTLNGPGALVVRATRVGEDTLLSEIGRLVSEAETSRVPLQRTADRLAAVFVPFVLALSVAAGFLWLAVGAGPTIAVLAFVSVCITACPCAFGLATPAALVVGTGRAASEGVLFKGRDSLERASAVDLVVTDKTGTLTEGRPEVAAIRPAPGVTESELLALAAGVESGSEHPFARAILSLARGRGVPPAPVRDVRSEPGVGAIGRLDGSEVSVRRYGAGASGAVPSGPLGDSARELRARGASVSIVWEGSLARGLLAFDDPMTPGIAEAVAALREDGIETVLLTGDHEAAARRVADRAGIRTVFSDQSPADKRARIEGYRRAGRNVAFVGDGLNDAPALAAADLGIAIGSGTEVAREAAGVVLVRHDFRGVALALRIGRRTVARVRSNLAWAIGYNAVLLPIAMGALVPIWGLGLFALLPVMGALAMALSSTSVLVNSLSLRWVSLGIPRPADVRTPAMPA